jgi:septal ring-binding cell division protein DamX
MIDEIPERDSIPTKSQAKPMSLARLAILLSLVFAVLLVMLLGSRALDILAAKLWPAPTDSKIEVGSLKTGTRIDVSKANIPTMNSGPVPIPGQTNPANQIKPTNLGNNQTVQTNPAVSQNALNQQSTLTNSSNTKTDLQSTADAPLLAAASLFSAEQDKVGNDTPSIDKDKNAAILATPQALAAEQPVNKEESKITSALETSLKNASQAIQKEKEQKLQQNLQSSKQKLPSKETKQYSAQEKEILKNDPRHYTLQILGMHNQTKLKSFINGSKLQGKVRYCRGDHQGKPWYILVYGEYATREEAEKVLANLPEDIKKQKPWVRSFASLQGTLHARE